MKDLDWYVLVVSPLCEMAVARRLCRRLALLGERVETFVPVVTDRVRRRHRRIDVERLLLPRYLFVGFDTTVPRWLDVHDVMGVQGVIGIAGKPARLDPTIVGDLMSKCLSGYFQARVGQVEPPRVQRGMRVVVADGPLRGHEGDVVSISKQDQCAEVLFELFKGQTFAKIHLDDLVSVSYSSRRMIG